MCPGSSGLGRFTMRYRMRVSRVQQAERVVNTRDEDEAIANIGVELERPYGMITSWTTVATDVEVLSAESALSGMPTAPDGGPLLLGAVAAIALCGAAAAFACRCPYVSALYAGRRPLNELARSHDVNRTTIIKISRCSRRDV